MSIVSGFFSFISILDPNVDLYPQNVVLLAHMEGTNGATSFTEQLGNAFSVAAGSPTISTAVAKFGSSSLSHPANSYMTTPASTTFDITTGPFTVEAFIYITAYNATANNGITILCNTVGTGGSGWVFGMSATGTQLQFSSFNAGATKDSSLSTSFTALSLNAWHHIAVSFDGTTYGFYADGTRYGTATSAGSVPAGGALSIGAYTQNLSYPSYYWAGYLDEIRITKGTGRYSAAAFTVPTTAFPNPGSAFVDQYFSNVVLLLNLNSSLIDTSSKSATVTTSGTTPAYITSASTPPAKVGSGSLTLVSGTRLLTPATANMTFTGDFTMECWLYPDQVTNPAFLDTFGSATTGYQFFITAGTLRFYWNGNNYISHTTAITANNWHHIAVSRTGTTVSLFLDGVLGATSTVTGTIAPGQSNMAINYQQSGGPVDITTGYMDEVRITNGVGRYTTNFTPSTAQSLSYILSGGLTWVVPGAGILPTTTMTYPSTMSYASGLTLNGQTGWRLPTVAEIQALISNLGLTYLRNVGWPTAAYSWGWVGTAFNAGNQYVHGMDTSAQSSGTPTGFSYGNNTTDKFGVYYLVRAST